MTSFFFQGNGKKYFYFYVLYPEMNFLTRILYGLMYYTFRYFKNHLIFVNTQIQYGRWPPSWISRNRPGYKKIDCQNNGLWGDLNKNQPSNLGVIEMYTGLMASSRTIMLISMSAETSMFITANGLSIQTKLHLKVGIAMTLLWHMTSPRLSRNALVSPMRLDSMQTC